MLQVKSGVRLEPVLRWYNVRFACYLGCSKGLSVKSRTLNFCCISGHGDDDRLRMLLGIQALVTTTQNRDNKNGRKSN